MAQLLMTRQDDLDRLDPTGPHHLPPQDWGHGGADGTPTRGVRGVEGCSARYALRVACDLTIAAVLLPKTVAPASRVEPGARCASDVEWLDVHDDRLLAAHRDAAFHAGLASLAGDGTTVFAPGLDEASRAWRGLLPLPKLTNAHADERAQGEAGLAPRAPRLRARRPVACRARPPHGSCTRRSARWADGRSQRRCRRRRPACVRALGCLSVRRSAAIAHTRSAALIDGAHIGKARAGPGAAGSSSAPNRSSRILVRVVFGSRIKYASPLRSV